MNDIRDSYITMLLDTIDKLMQQNRELKGRIKELESQRGITITNSEIDPDKVWAIVQDRLSREIQR